MVCEIMKVKPRVRGDGIVLSRLTSLAIGIELDPLHMIDDQVRHRAVIRYEFRLQ